MQICPLALQDSRVDAAVAVALTALVASATLLRGDVDVARRQVVAPSVKYF